MLLSRGREARKGGFLARRAWRHLGRKRRRSGTFRRRRRRMGGRERGRQAGGGATKKTRGETMVEGRGKRTGAEREGGGKAGRPGIDRLKKGWIFLPPEAEDPPCRRTLRVCCGRDWPISGHSRGIKSTSGFLSSPAICMFCRRASLFASRDAQRETKETAKSSSRGIFRFQTPAKSPNADATEGAESSQACRRAGKIVFRKRKGRRKVDPLNHARGRRKIIAWQSHANALADPLAEIAFRSFAARAISPRNFEEAN